MPKEKRIIITNKCVDKFTYGIDTYGEPQLLKHSSVLTEVIKTRGKELNPLEVKAIKDSIVIYEDEGNNE